MRVIAGAVLAAGAGRRMGGPKADLIVGGVRLVDRAVATLVDGGCRPVFAVVRAGTEVGGAQAVVNPDPDRGMRSSLELAIAAATEVAADALLVVLVDTPGVGGDAVDAVRRAWRPGRIAVARFAQRVFAHPIAMSPVHWRESIEAAGPDEGARRYLATRAALVDQVPVGGDPTDLDAPQDVPDGKD